MTIVSELKELLLSVVIILAVASVAKAWLTRPKR